tara:strand:- start:9729 stop:10310 length:582 start_codon:yes stop_codon:yes gene_type:complete
MASEVQICNLALAKVGEEQITSLGEDSKVARLCNLVYEPQRDAVLRAHPWNFAVYRENLALDTTAPAYEYSSRFALPTDFLRLLGTNMLDTSEFVIESGYILCDESSLIAKFIKRVTDANQFDWLFIECLSAKIAAELAIAIADNRALSVDLFNLYKVKLAEARSTDAQEGTPQNLIADTWLNARQSAVGTVS